MGLGLISTHANSWLNMLKATAYTAPAGSFVKLHIGDPGAAAATSPSAVVTRQSVTWTNASGGILTMTAPPTGWAMTTGETISHISLWDASTVGNALWTVALTTPKAVLNGDTLTLSTFTLQLSLVAV